MDLFVVGEISPKSKYWSPSADFSLVWAEDEKAVKKLLGEDQKYVTKVDLNEPCILYDPANKFSGEG
jgi:hypothetical protein